jgi:hypothetical protein
MNQEEWEYDNVYFIGQIRRSGGSLVITIPTELKDRFLIREGQKVKIIGVTRKKPYLEGGFLIYLGRFIINEEVLGSKITIEIKEGDVESVLEELREILERDFQATDIFIERVDENRVLIEAYFGIITEKGVLLREEDVSKRFKKEFTRVAKELGCKVVAMEFFKDVIKWDSLDPSILKRYLVTIPENISYEWKMV